MLRPIGRETAHVATRMAVTCTQSEDVGIVAAAAATRLQAVS